MPWYKENDLANDPSYLEPRINEIEAKTADLDSVKQIEDITKGGKWVWKLDNGALYLEQVE